MLTLEAFKNARSVLQGVLRPTPLIHSPYLSKTCGNNGNIIKLEHNQFVNINRQSGVELRVTLEAFGHDHKQQILDALRQDGYQAQLTDTGDFYT